MRATEGWLGLNRRVKYTESKQTDSWQQETNVNGILCHGVSQIAVRIKKGKESKTGTANHNLIM